MGKDSISRVSGLEFIMRGWMGTRGEFDFGDEDHNVNDLLCPPHANLAASGKLKSLDNCVACIRNERDELREHLRALGVVLPTRSCPVFAYNEGNSAKPLEEYAANDRAAKLRGVSCCHCATEIYLSPNPKFPDLWIHRETQETYCRGVYAYPQKTVETQTEKGEMK
jgi:hypothetical protein